ncbi:NAD kinase-like isoform X3 [Dreissena polymorpha]|uniref:NAD kinase-like isoform X3 n=1 Tax=Dreissena polymorpha TaxID=45954 RepID=UPI002264D0C1|nr:NAD kinase-like isoform X3 [Dreissena polymorpha]
MSKDFGNGKAALPTVKSEESLPNVSDKKCVAFAMDTKNGAQGRLLRNRPGSDSCRKRRAHSLYGVSPNCKFGPKGSLLDNSGTVLTIPDPGSQKLNWHKAPLTVLVVKKIYDESVLQPFKNLISWLIEVRKMIVYVESNVLDDGILADDTMFKKYRGRLQTFKQGQDDLTDKIDFIICLGGDGTLLHASTLFQQSCPPVMAFHQGSLGFLTPFTFDNFETQVSQVLDGNASLLLRYRLKCVICKEDSDLGRVSRIKHIDSKSQCAKSHILVLNEVVIDRGSSSFICNIDLYVEGRLVTSVQGDGLIISTPTGSTAYAVAAGASMIHPNVPAIMITPICPHSLSFRPIVVPAGVEIKVMLSPDARNSAMVSFDGRNRQEIHQGESVRITTAQFPLPAVCAKDQIEDWFDRLGECLHWNVRKTQKQFVSSDAYSDTSLVSTSSHSQNGTSSEKTSETDGHL